MAGERSAPFGLIAVAIAMAAVVGTNRSAPAGRDAASAPADSSPRAATGGVAPADTAGRSGRDLLREFFGTRSKSDSAVPDSFSLGVLIATVPDPYDSHLDWSFDAGLEAIRRAFETSDYVVDRFWLPGPKDSLAPAPGRPRVALRELRPGVMLFRRVQPDNLRLPADSIRLQQDSLRLELLYLVPELPTRGIHKEALRTALQERQALLHPDPGAADPLPLRRDSRGPIRIVGPNFSGAALSLRFVLQQWLAGRPADSVALISGSATSMANKAIFHQPGVSFHATINPDQALDRVLVGVVLPCLGLLPSQVALLQESSTQYGQGLLDQVPGGAGRMVGGRQTPSCTGPTIRKAQDSQFVVIPFPMSISSLRAEYQRVPAGTAPPPGLPGAAEAPRLPLDLLDPTRPKEDLPVSSRLSPVALDLLLDEVARTITRRQVKLVGLLATDVRDKLFLGDEIRKRVRDVQFFTYESNVLYLRADRSEALRGMLVLSTYPLVLENQWMTSDPSGTRRFAFGSDGAQGVYNATLLQLGQARSLLDYRRGRNIRTPTPPVWLSTVGNRIFLPVTTISDPKLAAGYLASGCPPAEAGGKQECAGSPSEWPPLRLSFLPLATIMLASLALLVVGLEGLVIDRALSQRPVTSTDTAEKMPLGDRVIVGSLKLHDRLYHLLRLVAVTGIFIAATAPVLPLAGHRSQPVLLLIFGLIFAAAVLGLAALLSGCVTLWRILRGLAGPGWEYFAAGPHWNNRQADMWLWRIEVVARCLIAGFGLVYLALSIAFALEIHGLPSFWMFFRRAIEVDSLVSPVLPLVLGGIGYAVWCTWHIERIELLRLYTTFEHACEEELGSGWEPKMTFRSALRDDLRRVGRVARTIRGRLFQVVPSPGALGVLVAFTALGWWLSPLFGRSLESLLIRPRLGSLGAFDVLFRATVLASMFATAWGAYRLAVVWAGLRQCLSLLAQLPVVTAFQRLPPRVARLTRLTLPGFTPSVPVGVIADVQWLHLQRIYETRRDEFGKLLGTGEHDLGHRIERLMRAHAAVTSGIEWSGRTALVARFSGMHELLRELWRLEPLPEDVDALVTGLGKDAGRDAGMAEISTTLLIRRGFNGPVRLWLRAAEEYSATRMVEYVEWVIRHLRILALFMLLSLLLTTLFVSSYPYQPQSLLRLILLLVLLGSVGAFVVVLVQMNRNEVLSRIARTEPGQVTWNSTFILNLLTFGVVPLLTLLSSEFPGLRIALFSWVQPLVSAVVKQ
jgi:hypothetical protein